MPFALPPRRVSASNFSCARSSAVPFPSILRVSFTTVTAFVVVSVVPQAYHKQFRCAL